MNKTVTPQFYNKMDVRKSNALAILRPPSYLSMEYALYKHDILSQQVYSLTFIITKLLYTYKTLSHVYEFHQVKKSLFWGFQTNETIHIADAEKALLDFIYICYA